MYFRLMAAIFDLLFTLTSESIRISCSVLLDPEHVGGSRCNLVAIIYTSRDIRNCICRPTYGYDGYL